jgi:type II secretory pathway component PulK
MFKKGTILAISCWVLVILVVFALSLGHRSAVILRISNFQKNRLKAYCIAYAGLNRAILELNNDAVFSSYDSLDEAWVDNEKIFKKIELDENSNNFATVSYQDQNGETKFGVQDEESKINLNKAPLILLTQLFSNREVERDRELAAFVVKWREPALGNSPPASEEEKIIKHENLKIPQELLLILEYFYKDKAKATQAYNKIKPVSTIYGAGKININTVSKDNLTVLVNFVVSLNPSGLASANAPALVEALLWERQASHGFKDETQIQLPAGADPAGLLGAVKSFLTVRSSNFTIEVEANAGGTVKEIKAVYERPHITRTKGRIVYWHEN